MPTSRGVGRTAASISEEKDTIEDVIEPYLIQQGYLMRTPRGRVATVKCYEYFGITPPNEASGPKQRPIDQKRLDLD